MTVLDEFLLKIVDRVDYLKLAILERDDVHSAPRQMAALRRDADSCNEKRGHYTFDSLATDEFTDYFMARIATALEKSQKATEITLAHGGDVSDFGMKRFLKALQKTQAPIKSLTIEDFPFVSDESMSLLPSIIKEKGILSCRLGLLNISPTLQTQIANACHENVAFLSKGFGNER
ncbi:MAG: hypothetical protein E7013_02800 [Alphaproteobacteria bacterium]|nr:hypothetical protein [Alphaproteobacteria bacterium]